MTDLKEMSERIERLTQSHLRVIEAMIDNNKGLKEMNLALMTLCDALRMMKCQK